MIKHFHLLNAVHPRQTEMKQLTTWWLTGQPPIRCHLFEKFIKQSFSLFSPNFTEFCHLQTLKRCRQIEVNNTS